MNTRYTGERVRLRTWADREEYNSALCQATMESNPWWGPQWYTGCREYFDGAGMLHTDGHSSFALELAGDGRWIGLEDCGDLSITSPAAWVGTYVLPGYQGQGFGTEAKQLMFCYLFENYPVQVVWADTVATHRWARRSLEHSGMHYFGRKRCAVISKGCYTDQVFYRIFREEWEQLPIRKIVRRG